MRVKIKPTTNKDSWRYKYAGSVVDVERDSDEFLDWLFEYAEIPFDRHSYEEEFIKYKKGKLDEN